MIIERLTDCANSPKNQIVETLAIAIYTNDTATIKPFLSTESNWEFFECEVSSKGMRFSNQRKTISILNGMKERDRSHFAGLRVRSAFTHGKIGAVELEWLFEAEVCFREAVFFEFHTAKAVQVKQIRSYFSV